MNQDTTIVHRRLTSNEAKLLSRCLKTTSVITGYSHNELLSQKDIWIAESKNAFSGACIIKDITANWSEVAMLYVIPEFRQQGIGTKLLTQAFRSLKERKRNIYCVSRNQWVVDHMKKEGMTLTHSLWNLPLPILFHIFRFACNGYRVKEFLRKSLLFRNSKPFVYGILQADPVVRTTVNQ